MFPENTKKNSEMIKMRAYDRDSDSSPAYRKNKVNDLFVVYIIENNVLALNFYLHGFFHKVFVKVIFLYLNNLNTLFDADHFKG